MAGIYRQPKAARESVARIRLHRIKRRLLARFAAEEIGVFTVKVTAGASSNVQRPRAFEMPSSGFTDPSIGSHIDQSRIVVLAEWHAHPQARADNQVLPVFCEFYCGEGGRADEVYRKSKERIGQPADLSLVWLAEDETFRSQSGEGNNHVELGRLAEDIQHPSIREKPICDSLLTSSIG